MSRKNFRIVSVVLAFLLVLAGLLVVNGNSNLVNAASKNKNRIVRVRKRSKKTKKSKIKRPLIVVFSNKTAYDQNNLPVGHTMVIARDIQKRTRARLYEIKPVNAYPTNYEQLVKVAQNERNRNIRPAIAGKLPKFSKYSTVFVGSPVWWGTYPMVVRSFFDKAHGLNGKTLIPFSTSAGSGLGDEVHVLRKTFPKSRIRSGYTTLGTNANQAKNSVNRWLRRLGY